MSTSDADDSYHSDRLIRSWLQHFSLTLVPAAEVETTIRVLERPTALASLRYPPFAVPPFDFKCSMMTASLTDGRTH